MSRNESHSVRNCPGYFQFLSDFYGLVASVAAEGKLSGGGDSCNHVVVAIQKALDSYRGRCLTLKNSPLVVHDGSSSATHDGHSQGPSECDDDVSASSSHLKAEPDLALTSFIKSEPIDHELRNDVEADGAQGAMKDEIDSNEHEAVPKNKLQLLPKNVDRGNGNDRHCFVFKSEQPEPMFPCDIITNANNAECSEQRKCSTADNPTPPEPEIRSVAPVSYVIDRDVINNQETSTYGNRGSTVEDAAGTSTSIRIIDLFKLQHKAENSSAFRNDRHSESKQGQSRTSSDFEVLEEPQRSGHVMTNICRDAKASQSKIENKWAKMEKEQEAKEQRERKMQEQREQKRKEKREMRKEKRRQKRREKKAERLRNLHKQNVSTAQHSTDFQKYFDAQPNAEEAKSRGDHLWRRDAASLRTLNVALVSEAHRNTQGTSIDWHNVQGVQSSGLQSLNWPSPLPPYHSWPLLAAPHTPPQGFIGSTVFHSSNPPSSKFWPSFSEPSQNFSSPY